MLTSIKFTTNTEKLREMAYGDIIYAWMLLHSHYSPDEDHNYIYAKEFTIKQIAADIGRTRQTVSKRFHALLDLSEKESNFKNLIWYNEKDKCYILPCFREYQSLDSQTILNLFRLTSKAPRREELVKTYAWLKKCKANNVKDISLTDIIHQFGHSTGNEETYNRYKDIMTTLQGAGLIKFRTDLDNNRNNKGRYDKTFYVYQVNDKASQEWLDKEYGEEE